MRIGGTTTEPSAVDFALESTEGDVHTLAEHRGSTVVVFYEARDRTGDNARLKQALEELEPGVRAGLVVIAAGDMRAFDVPGARPVARVAARALAARYGFEILLDWKGVLTRPPFDLDASKSNVVVVDPRGKIAFRHTGLLGPQEIARFFGALRHPR